MICKDVLQLRGSNNVKNLFIAINIFLLYMKRLFTLSDEENDEEAV